MVLSAGVTRDNAFPSIDDAGWDDVLRTNLVGFYNVLHPLTMPLIRRRDSGRIVAIASVSGVIGNRGQVNDSASKAGLIGAAKALAVDLAKRKITVNCGAPGLIETAMSGEVPQQTSTPSRCNDRWKRSQRLAFLFSRGGHITRQVIGVNGVDLHAGRRHRYTGSPLWAVNTPRSPPHARGRNRHALHREWDLN